MRNKRGAIEFGVGVSIFIFIMALLMVIYLLLIPEEERQQILEGKEGVSLECERRCQTDFERCKSDCGDDFDCKLDCSDRSRACRDNCVRFGDRERVGVRGGLLLSESPGLVRPIQNFQLGVDLNPVSLFSEVRRINTPLVSSLSISAWFFSKEDKTVSFDLGGVENLAKVTLIFFPGDRKGGLKLKLNENIIYEGDANVNDLPIELPVSLLKAKDNKLVFSSTDGGLSKSYFSFKDLSLSVERFEQNLRASRKFVLTKEEVQGIKRAFLSYFISCGNINVRQGNLRIDFNGKSLYDDLIFCEAARPSLDISKNLVREGENQLQFVLKPSTENSYDITEIKFNADMRNFEFPKYRFDLGRREFEDVASGRVDVKLNLIFADRGFRKEASININGAELYFNTNEGFITLDLSDFIVAGSNFIKIVPRESFEIERLDVVIG